jgi:RNA 3'-terminal phosphate cyclase (ATP)
LKQQHLTALRAACEISNAEAAGDYLGSLEVEFSPGEIQSGKYHFNIPTAGSTSLVLQTIFLPLSTSKQPSRIEIQGGTHVPWSPPYHYLKWQWLSWMEQIGFPGSLTLEKCGYYPAGGGEISATILPSKSTESLSVIKRGNLIQIRGVSGVTNLPLEIAKRQRQRFVSRLGAICPLNDIRVQSIPGPNKGTFLVVLVEFEHSTACFSALGRKGKRAEEVSDEVVKQVQEMISTTGCVDRFLPDQLLLPLCFSNKRSRIKTVQITEHLLTNARVIQKFLPAEIEISGKLGSPGVIVVKPIK